MCVVHMIRRSLTIRYWLSQPQKIDPEDVFRRNKKNILFLVRCDDPIAISSSFHSVMFVFPEVVCWDGLV